MKYSILVACYDPEGLLKDMTAECLSLIEKHSKGDYELLTDPDPGKTGWSGVYNRLMQRAQGEYLILCANDVMIEDPDWLEKLSVPDTIASPHLIPFFHKPDEKHSYASIFGMPKSVQEKIGLIDEQFRDGYGYDDNDYFHRAVLLGINQVEVPLTYRHAGSQTYRTYWTEREHIDNSQLNRNLFYKKWKI